MTVSYIFLNGTPYIFLRHLILLIFSFPTMYYNI